MGYKAELVAPPQIEHAILLIRGQRVMLGRDLAAMYGVTTSNFHVRETGPVCRVKVKRK